jgi:hypothetical protein
MTFRMVAVLGILIASVGCGKKQFPKTNLKLDYITLVAGTSQKDLDFGYNENGLFNRFYFIDIDWIIEYENDIPIQILKGSQTAGIYWEGNTFEIDGWALRYKNGVYKIDSEGKLIFWDENDIKWINDYEAHFFNDTESLAIIVKFDDMINPFYNYNMAILTGLELLNLPNLVDGYYTNFQKRHNITYYGCFRTENQNGESVIRDTLIENRFEYQYNDIGLPTRCIAEGDFDGTPTVIYRYFYMNE